MTIRAVVFDIGGVLEITPDLHLDHRWETRLGLPPGELDRRLADVWAAGEIGATTEPAVHRAVRDRLGITPAQAEALLADMWVQYLGTANAELIEYARRLRPGYRTGILSNSFVGAREREQAAYGFEDLVDEIVYSHEVGVSKPDPRSYHLICHRLGVRPADAVLVDDTARMVAAAQTAGLQAVHHQDNPTTIAALATLLPPP